MSLFPEMQPQILQVFFNLPLAFEETIVQLKKELYKQYGDLKRVKSIPHLSLCEIHCPATSSNQLIEKLENILVKTPAIKVTTNNFYTFDTNFLIAAKIDLNEPYSQLIHQFRQLSISYPFLQKSKNYALSTTPHVTVALARNREEYFSIKPQFEGLRLDEELWLNELMIRVSNDDGTTYQLVKKIKLRHE